MTTYLLRLEQVASLFEYVESKLEETECDHSCRHTKQWLSVNIPQEQQDAILAEISGESKGRRDLRGEHIR